MDRIRQLRIECGLTQRELAEQLRVRQPSVAMWETGLTMPRADRLPALARALHVNVGELFDYGSAQTGCDQTKSRVSPA